MEKQISPDANVADLELEAVIGFNGEASNRTSGSCDTIRSSKTPGATWKAVWDTGMSTS